MSRILFFDCGMGVAGDMITSALLDLFPDPEQQLAKLNAIHIPGVLYQMEKIVHQGISGLHITVKYLGETEGEPSPRLTHISMGRIYEIIGQLSLPETVRDHVRSVYEMIAKAESMAHGHPVEEIHLHELGTMDAIADISAAALLLHELSPDYITASPIRVGYGNVKTAHGMLPVPAPATANLLQGIPCYAGDLEGEFCTPTGAALLRHYAGQFSQLPPMTLQQHGYGMGTRVFEGRLNAVHVLMGEPEQEVIELSCNIDDMTPEDIANALEVFMKEGALDASWHSIGMKKGRPGVRIDLLCRPEDRDRMVHLMFQHTTTIGLREYLCARKVLSRTSGISESPWGPIRYKRSEGHGVCRIKPEYEDLSGLAEKNSVPISEIRKGFEETLKP